MIRVQFNNEFERLDCTFKYVNKATVRLIGNDITEHTDGFVLYQPNGVLLGDYSDYKRCVKCSGGYTFSKVQ